LFKKRNAKSDSEKQDANHEAIPITHAVPLIDCSQDHAYQSDWQF
tara:strand:- start:356 stop:490 length:135 start_codon:yes stop_codon:yes gene_type:complete